LFILCEEIGGTLQAGSETLDAQFFTQTELPPLSIERITKEQIDLLFELYENNSSVNIPCD